MIEYICDNCGKRIDNLPDEVKIYPFKKHICKDCIRERIREYAKKVADAPLGYASYGQLLCIYQNLNVAYINAKTIKTPWKLPKCHVCGSEMRVTHPAEDEYICEKCMAVYDRFGNKVRDTEVKE